MTLFSQNAAAIDVDGEHTTTALGYTLSSSTTTTEAISQR